MDNFEDFKAEVIAEIRANPHLYPTICRRMVRKIEEQRAEVERLQETLASHKDCDVLAWNNTGLELTITNLTADLARVSAERDELKTELDRRREEIKGYESFKAITDLRVERDSWQSRHHTKSIRLAAVRMRAKVDMERLAEERDECKAELNAAEIHTEFMSSALSGITAERDAARAALATIEQSAVELKTRLAAVQVELAEVVRERSLICGADEMIKLREDVEWLFDRMGLKGEDRNIDAVVGANILNKNAVKLQREAREAAEATLSLIRSAVGEDVVGAVEKLKAERDKHKVAYEYLMDHVLLTPAVKEVARGLASKGDTGRGDKC